MAQRFEFMQEFPPSTALYKYHLNFPLQGDYAPCTRSRSFGNPLDFNAGGELADVCSECLTNEGQEALGVTSPAAADSVESAPLDVDEAEAPVDIPDAEAPVDIPDAEAHADIPDAEAHVDIPDAEAHVDIPDATTLNVDGAEAPDHASPADTAAAPMSDVNESALRVLADGSSLEAQTGVGDDVSSSPAQESAAAEPSVSSSSKLTPDQIRQRLAKIKPSLWQPARGYLKDWGAWSPSESVPEGWIKSEAFTPDRGTKITEELRATLHDKYPLAEEMVLAPVTIFGRDLTPAPPSQKRARSPSDGRPDPAKVPRLTQTPLSNPIWYGTAGSIASASGSIRSL